MGNSSSSSASSNGCGWSNYLTFYNAEDGFVGNRTVKLSGSDKEGWREHISDDSVKIKDLRLYTNAVWEGQTEQWATGHAFILFSDGHHWYSIEKNDTGIILQRSDNFSHVYNKIQGTNRLDPIYSRHSATGRDYVMDIRIWLHNTDELTYPYYWGAKNRNCQGFACRFWKRFARDNHVTHYRLP